MSAISHTSGFPSADVGGGVARPRTGGARGATGRSSSRADLRVGSLYRRFALDMKPRPVVYWADMLASAGLGWGAFLFAGFSQPGSWPAILAGTVSMFALYRAVLFIHELSHLKPGSLPGFEVAWSLLVGIPLGVPSLMYVPVHLEHHRRRLFGTSDDPEYIPMAHWTPSQIAFSALPMLSAPIALALRWALGTPLSLFSPKLREFLVGKASTLLINPAYTRKMPEGRHAVRWYLGEAGCCLYFWAVGIAVYTGVIGLHWVFQFYCITAALLLVNHGRTLTAHRYDNEDQELDTEGQLLDSINLLGRSWFTGLVAPVGLRYHALHHLLPAVPYHALGQVHRAMLTELPAGSVYRSTDSPGLFSALRSLFKQSRSHR